MEQQPDFHIEKTWDNKTKFIIQSITITVTQCAIHNSKHQIIEPSTASALLVCGRTRFVVMNTSAIETVEDWYEEELFTKFQLLSLLEAGTVIEEPASKMQA